MGTNRTLIPLARGVAEGVTRRALAQLEEAVAATQEQLATQKLVVLPGVFTATASGLVPASGGGTLDYLRADGTWNQPPGGGGGGLYSSFLSAVPTQANTGFTTWMGSPTGTSVTDLSAGMTVSCTISPSAAGLRQRAAPTPPYTITALVMSQALCSSTSGGDGALLFGWSDGTKFQVFRFDVVSGTPGNYLSVSNFPSITSSAASTPWFVGANTTGMAPFIWLRLRDDGTNFSFDFGFTGEDWLTPVTAAKSAGYLAGSYSNIVFGTNFANIPTQAKLASWTIS